MFADILLQFSKLDSRVQKQSDVCCRLLSFTFQNLRLDRTVPVNWAVCRKFHRMFTFMQ